MKVLGEFVHSQYRKHRSEEVVALGNLVAGDDSTVFEDIPLLEGQLSSPFAYTHLASEAVAQGICERAMLTRSFFEVYGVGRTYDEVLSQVEAAEPKARLAAHFHPDKTYRFTVMGFGRSFTKEEQFERMSRFKHLVPEGMRARMKNADAEFCIIEDVGLDENGNGRGEVAPFRVFLARRICENVNKTKVLQKLGLKNGRAYLGPTSMDTEISLLMANMAQSRKDSLVLDPFVGTGSILVACAWFGAQTMGGDIDMRVLRGWIGTSNRSQVSVWKNVPRADKGATSEGEAEAAGSSEKKPGRGEGARWREERGSSERGEKRSKVGSNFEQYGLADPCTIRCDNSVRVWRSGMCDAIVADPPYGVRAGAWKVGATTEAALEREREKGERMPGGDHRPETVEYQADEVLTDLLELAAHTLVLGGRLVFFLPTVHGRSHDEIDEGGDDEAAEPAEEPLPPAAIPDPEHPCLTMLSGGDTEIGGGKLWRRRLVTMIKHREP